MKKFTLNISLAFVLGMLFFLSCEKAEPLKVYQEGIAPFFVATKTGNTASFDDSSLVVLNLSWSDPNHGQNKSSYKYYVEIDSSKNFSNPTVFNIENKNDFKAQILGHQLNNALIKYDYSDPGSTYTLYLRLVSSYANNNDQKKSIVASIQVSPYPLPKIKAPVNGEIWLVGAATEIGWTNPLPIPYVTDQKFKKISASKYELTVYLYPDEYLILPVNGSWDSKYCLNQDSDKEPMRNGGDFVYRLSGGSNFLAPQNEGEYIIFFDFMTGKFTVTPNN